VQRNGETPIMNYSKTTNKSEILVESIFGNVAKKVLSAAEIRACERVVRACDAHVLNKRNAFINRHKHGAVLYSYKSDAWSALCSDRVVEGFGDCVVTRSGKMLHEFLMERAFLKASTVSGPELLMVFGAPRGMSNGKAATYCFGAGCEFSSMLRRLGCEGICLSQYGADRAVVGRLGMLFTVRHAMYYDPRYGPALGAHSWLLRLTDWVIVTPCFGHDVSNALKWGLVHYSL